MKDRTRHDLDKIKPLVPKNPAAEIMFRFQEGLAQSQWYDAERLAQYQLEKLQALVRFALGEVPFWRDKITAGAVAEAKTLAQALSAIPVLTRLALQDSNGTLFAERLPQGHAPDGERKSSGSTGMAVTVRTTTTTAQWQSALTFRAHLWAGADFRKPCAVLRRIGRGVADYPDGLRLPAWDSPDTFPFPTGPGFRLSTGETSVQQQWEWLARTEPSYLVTYPSVVRALAEHAAGEGHPPTRLKGITTLGEMVDRELRDMAAKHLKTEIHDIYSSEEVGCMALQCPSCRLYHVQAESVILEVLDENDRPCRAGETGRVVVTSLFNYATPLLRYDIGDFAELGGTCACGRGLPMLNRIQGRRRNMLTLADGRRFWPALGVRRLQRIARIRQHQFRQTAPDTVEAWLVTAEPLSSEQKEEMRKIIAASLPAPLNVEIHAVDTIPAFGSGKYEEFVSLVNPAAGREKAPLPES